MSITCIASYKSSDLCPKGDLGWISGQNTLDSEGNTVSNDHDVDGCNDEGSKNNNFGEDTDDDNDGVLDPNDACPKGEINWTSSIIKTSTFLNCSLKATVFLNLKALMKWYINFSADI